MQKMLSRAKWEIVVSIDEQFSLLRTVILRNLAYIGEQCLNKARSTDSYKDQTGNLRSSIGYVIVEDGKVIQASDFAPSEKGTDKAKGQATGKAYASELAARFPSGITLLVVAGMNYATYVSAKGYDVLVGAELLADQLTDKLLKDLGFN